MNLRAILVAAVSVFPGACAAGGGGNAFPEPFSPRPTLLLDGTWSFATDPDDRGEKEEWYRPGKSLPPMPRPGYAPSADGRIRVPGIWDNQGYGVETAKLRHNFVGKGWYRRTAAVPADWKGRRVFLRVGGVHRAAKVWVNGRFQGGHVGYLSEFEFDVTGEARPGSEITIVLCVDSKQRPETDPLYGTADLADFMEVEWGGIWGHVLLEARNDAWLEGLFLRPGVSPPRCAAGAAVRGRAEEALLEVFDPSGRPAAWARRAVPATGPVELDVDLPGAALWTPDTPHLYRARLSLYSGGKLLDGIEERFGVRRIEVRGPHLLLNGQRLFLRGYGDDHIYVREMALPAEKALHLERLKLAKSYGFNHVRHHSAIMPPEYYEACDEAGILSTAEFPIAYQNFYGRAARSPDALDTYRREWAAAITRHRNHPSILCWVMGNELWNGVPLSPEFAAVARKLDPTRPFADTDGLYPKVLSPGGDRDTLDLYFLMFDVQKIPLDRPDKFRTDRPLKPVVSHESGNYVTFPRPDQFEAFTGNIKPFWVTPGIERMSSLGLAGEAGQWARNSERLYLLCHKLNLEALRKNPFISGHHWWLFQDYWTTSNGLVDSTFRPKSIRPEEVRRFVNDVVLLEDGLGLTYAAGDSLKTELRISNGSPREIAGGVLSWRLRMGDRVLGSGVLHPGEIGQGEVSSAGRLEVQLPEVPRPERIHLEADLDTGSGRYGNDWTAWVVPPAAGPARVPVPFFADRGVIGLLAGSGAAPLPGADPLPVPAVYVASFPVEPRLVKAALQGASLVVLNASVSGPPFVPGKFKPAWWKGGKDNDCGTVAYDHPLMREFAPEGWCDAGWYRLLQNCQRQKVEGPAAKVDVILRGIPHLQAMANLSVVFEARFGEGYVLMSGLNHRGAKDAPEGPWLLRRMAEHAAALPRPRGELSGTFFDPVKK